MLATKFVFQASNFSPGALAPGLLFLYSDTHMKTQNLNKALLLNLLLTKGGGLVRVYIS